MLTRKRLMVMSLRMKLVVRGRDAEGMMKVVRMVPVVSRYGMQMVVRRVVRMVVVTRNLMAVRQRGLVVERRKVMDRERMVVVLSPRSWRRVFGTTR